MHLVTYELFTFIGLTSTENVFLVLLLFDQFDVTGFQ